MKVNKNILIHGIFVFTVFGIIACTTGPEGMPTQLKVNCPEGERQLLDCKAVFQQFARTLRLDLGVVNSSAVGFGLGAQNLINLDSITGDLLAHQRQICIDFNNCLLTKKEYKQETRYLRRAQLKIREAANWAQSPSGTEAGTRHQPSPPGITEGKDESPEGKSEHAVIDQLDSLNEELKHRKPKGKEKEPASKKPATASHESIHFEHSIEARRKSPASDGSRNNYERIVFKPGITLFSGDQFKIRFVVDSDGFLYIINFDSSGKSQLIFPNSEISLNNRVEAGKRYEIPPDSDQWYYLDDVPGKETMYLIAAPFQIQNLDQLVAYFKSGRSSKTARYQEERLRGALEVLTRGVSEIVDDEKEIGNAQGLRTDSGNKTNDDETISRTHGMTAIRVEFYHR